MANGSNFLNRKITQKDPNFNVDYNELRRLVKLGYEEDVAAGKHRPSDQAQTSMERTRKARLEAEKGVKEPDYEDESTQKLLYGDEDVGAEATKFIDGSNGLAGAVAAGAANVNAAANNIAGGGTVVPLPVFNNGEGMALDLPYNLTGSTGLLGDETANALNPQAYAMQNAQVETPEDMQNQKDMAALWSKLVFGETSSEEEANEKYNNVLQAYRDGGSREDLADAITERIQTDVNADLGREPDGSLSPTQWNYGVESALRPAAASVGEGIIDAPIYLGAGIPYLLSYGIDQAFRGGEQSDVTKALGGYVENAINTHVLPDPEELIAQANEKYNPTEAQQTAMNLGRSVAEMVFGQALGQGMAGMASSASNVAGGAANSLNPAIKQGTATLSGKALDAATDPNLMSQITFASGAISNATQQAYKETGDPHRALSYGIMSGVVETAIENIANVAPGMFDENSITQTAISRIIDKLISNPTVNKAVNTLTNISGEGVEEIASAIIDPLVQYVSQLDTSITMPSWEELVENFAGGAIVAGVMRLGSGIALSGTQADMNTQSAITSTPQAKERASLVQPAEQKMLSPQESPIKSVVPLNGNGNTQTVQQDIKTQQGPIVEPTAPSSEVQQSVAELPVFANNVNQNVERDGSIINDVADSTIGSNSNGSETLTQLPIRNEDGSVNTANLLELRRNEWRFDTDLKRFNERSGITAAEKKVADLVASGDMDIRNIPKDMSAARIMEYATLKADADALHAPIREYNAEYQANLEARADAILEGSEDWKDMRTGLAYSIKTPERVIRKLVKNPAEQERVVDALIRTGAEADTRAVKIYNDIAEQVIPYKFTPEESKYIQMLGEGVITEAELPSNVSASRVKEGVQVFRGIYENLYQMVNEELVRTGQKPMGRIENYFPHISDPQDPMRRALKAMGFDVTPNALPTEINGRTEDFKPKHQWSRFMQRRTGNKTDYDALYGLDQYARSMANVVAYTDHIQLLRTVGNKVRFAHSDEGTQAKIREIMADQNLTVDEKQAAIDKFKANGDTHLSNLAAWLDEYANIIAGKKTRPDRVIEGLLGRRAYSAANWLSNQLSRSAVVGNIGSAATNLISSTQAVVFMSKPAMLKANIDMAKNLKHNDGLVERSKFLQRRFGGNKTYKTGIEKAMDKVDIMGLTDRYTAELIVRTKYNERLAKGDTPDAAMKYADGFAANLMGDRSRTQAPTAFGSKNPIYKALLQFQLEPFNQLGFLKTDAKRYAGSNGKAVGKLIEYALLMYLFNDAYEAIFGRRPALDPIGMANNVVGDATGKKLNNVFYMLGGEPVVRDVEQKSGTDTAKNAATNVMEQLPVLGSALGGGRVPVLNTLGKVFDFSLLGEVGQTIEGNMAPSKLRDDLGSWALETGAFLAPFGGGQAKKTIQGLQTFGAGGSYKRQNDGSEELQYEVDQNPWNLIKGVVGGKTAIGGGRYYEDGYPKAEPSTNEGIIEQHVRALPNIVTYKTGEGEDAEEHKITLSDDMRALRQQFARNLIPDGVDLIELDEDVRKDMFKAIDDFTLDAVLERTGHPEYTTSKDTNTAIEALKADVSLPVFYGIKQAFAEKNEDGDSLTKQQKRNILMDWPDLSKEQKTRLDEIMLDLDTGTDYSSGRTFELTNSGLTADQQQGYLALQQYGIGLDEWKGILSAYNAIDDGGDSRGPGKGGSAARIDFINSLPYNGAAKNAIANYFGINRDYSSEDAFKKSGWNESSTTKYGIAQKYIGPISVDEWEAIYNDTYTGQSQKKGDRIARLKKLGYSSAQAETLYQILKGYKKD